MKTISILGSTGSIGRSAVEIVLANPEKFRVAALAAGNNIDELERQIIALSPRIVSVMREDSALELIRRLNGRFARRKGIEILHGAEGLNAVATCGEAEFVLSAIVGASGLVPTLAAIEAGKTIGLANKESLVASGAIMMNAARRHGVRILPVDSEHSAIFQCLEGREPEDARRIILTASGGSLRHRPVSELGAVTVADALNHPNWSMGRKITVDSATLMNKGLEVIEARWLFDTPPERIDVVIHPQSIIHSMVEFTDGGVLAQLAMPDMKGPISYALAWPRRVAGAVEPLDLVKVGSLTFESPDMNRYPCLRLAFDALSSGGTMPAVMNAANEVAVAAFLDERIAFTDIQRVVSDVMSAHQPLSGETLDEVLSALDRASKFAQNRINSIN
ncbi:MAG: 1-deoxy-D-xylulose-5-phosphate reductoisomerase [Nitrospirae bacterium]|nr:1-deoxy-D-xylulose-5-phosphate reductoisomerase [Nitrospirota bacterium]